MQFTGERVEEKQRKFDLRFADHLARYDLAKPLCKDKVVLDIACGTGYGTSILAQVAQTIDGVDIDKDAIELAKKSYVKSNLTYTVGDGTTIPFEDNMFDVVISFETIEHIVEYHNFLKEIKRVLKPGGVLLMSTPNYKGELVKNTYHVTNFDTNTFVGSVKQHFDVQSVMYQGKHFYPLPGRGLVEWLFNIRRDVAIRTHKPAFEHHVTIIQAVKSL